MDNVGAFACLDEQADDVRAMVRRYVQRHPPDEHHGSIHGRTHTPSPEAVAQLKARLAQNGRQQPVKTANPLAARIAAQPRQRKQEQLEEVTEEHDDMANIRFSDDDVRKIWQEQIRDLKDKAALSQVLVDLQVTDRSYFLGRLRKLDLDYPGRRKPRPVRVQTEKKKVAAPVVNDAELSPVADPPADLPIVAVNGRQANAVAVADGADRMISLGRLVRDLQGAGVGVKVSGRVVIELEFFDGTER